LKIGKNDLVPGKGIPIPSRGRWWGKKIEVFTKRIPAQTRTNNGNAEIEKKTTPASKNRFYP